MSTQLVLASTAFGLATACAAIDAGLLGGPGRRVLVVTSNVAMPEGAPTLLDLPGVDTLLRRFDAVVDHNQTIEPLHPGAWAPRLQDLPLWERHFRAAWALADETVELVVESIAVDPSRALARIFADAPITVYADGLMSYGPTRTALPDQVGTRIERLVHLDLVPGLHPLLLAEWDVSTAVVPPEVFRSVIAELPVAPPLPGPTVIVLGQYLAAADLLTEDEELGLYAEMLLRCAEAGHSRIVFKAHPSAPPAYRRRLLEHASAARLDLRVVEEQGLAEQWFARGGVSLVVGSFSTALLTARELYGLPVAQLGAGIVLEQLKPYQNSNRIPATLVEVLVPDLRSWTAVPGGEQPPVVDVPGLVGAVGYAMQPELLRGRRAQAETFLADEPELRRRYVKARRLAALGLPGARARRPRAYRLAQKVWGRLAG